MIEPLPYPNHDISISPADHGEYITKRLDHYTITYDIHHDRSLMIHGNAQDLLNILTFLYEDTYCQYNQLVDLICIDRPGFLERFRLIYCLASLKYHRYIFFSCWCADLFVSISEIFSSAEIHERLVWDQFGIRFENHHDHRRVLRPPSPLSFPLRKDSPLRPDDSLHWKYR